MSVELQEGSNLLVEIFECLLGCLSLRAVGYTPSLSISLKPAIRELKAGINQLARLILSNPMWVLLAINCFGITLKPLASNCLSDLPAFFELFKKSLFQPAFLALCGTPTLLRASFLVGDTSSVLYLSL